ncbi:t-SNARE [Kalaharituber pfeilii]|nr:t-SNARE [Kalaharituber pfeilii]
MSFDRLSNLESQPTSQSTGYSDDPAFDRLANSLSSHLFRLNSNVTRLSSQIALMGTPKDSETIRDRVKTLMEQTREGFKQVGEGIKKVQAWENVSPSQRFSQTKLSRQFQTNLESFQGIQRHFAEKSRQYVIAARAAIDHGDIADDAVYLSTSPHGTRMQHQEQVPLVQQQLALAEQSEVDFQEMLINEREDDIRQIEQGISELNEIFRDLGTMVTEQGVMIESVEGNVQNTLTSTRDASRELVQANHYQKGARNRACCLLIILAVVLAVVLLAIFA